MTKSLIVLLDGIDETQRKLIHAQVKAHAEHWWHEMPDVWIIMSDESPAIWQQRLRVFVPTLPGFLLVFALPEGENRKWSGSGARNKWKWIHENYAAPGGQSARPLPENAKVNSAPVRLKL